MVEFPISSTKGSGHATRWRAKYPEKLSEYAKRVARSTDTLKDWIAKGKRSGSLPPLNSLTELPEWYSKHVGPVPDDLLAICMPAETPQAAAATNGESIKLESTVGEVRKILAQEIAALNSTGSDGRRAVLLSRIQRTADSLSKLEAALAKEREQSRDSQAVLSNTERKYLAEQSAALAHELRDNRETSSRQISRRALLRFGCATRLHDLRIAMSDLSDTANKHKVAAGDDSVAAARADGILAICKRLKAADSTEPSGSPGGVTVLETELVQIVQAVIDDWLSARESLFTKFLALREETNPGDWDRALELLQTLPRHLVEKLIQDFSKNETESPGVTVRNEEETNICAIDEQKN